VRFVAEWAVASPGVLLLGPGFDTMKAPMERSSQDVLVRVVGSARHGMALFTFCLSDTQGSDVHVNHLPG